MAHSSASPTSGPPYHIQRTVPRYSFGAVAEIVETTTHACVVGRVSEISRKGCYADIQNSLSVGTLLHLVLFHDGGSFATKGRVIYADEKGTGVTFVDPTDDQLKVLDSWIAERATAGTPYPTSAHGIPRGNVSRIGSRGTISWQDGSHVAVTF